MRTLFKLFVLDTAEKETNHKLLVARIGLFSGIGFFWLSIVWAIDPAPQIENAETIEGVIVDVDIGTRTRHWVTVKNTESEVTGVIYGRSLGDFLIDSVGKTVSIWHYQRPGLFFTSEIIIIEMKVGGEYVKENWSQIRETIKSPWYWACVVVGLVWIVISGFHIYRILNKRLRGHS